MRDDAAYYRDLSNVEQVEVLKGPGPVLFGRGSAGDFNRVTKRPNGERPVAEFSLTAGSYGVKRVTGDLGQAYLGGEVAWRLTGAGEDSGSHRDRFYLRRHAAAPLLAWRPGAATLLLAQGEHLDDPRLPDRGIPALGALPAPVRAGNYYGYAPEDFLRNLGTYSNSYPNGVQLSGGAWQVARAQYNVTQEQRNTFNQTDVAAAFRALGMKHRVLTGEELGAQGRRPGGAIPAARVDVVIRERQPLIPALGRRAFAGGEHGRP